MARLLFKLAQVPDDEAQEIRTLLNDHQITYYETDAGFFRVGLDAIWLADGTQEERARELSIKPSGLFASSKIMHNWLKRGRCPVCGNIFARNPYVLLHRQSLLFLWRV